MPVLPENRNEQIDMRPIADTMSLTPTYRQGMCPQTPKRLIG
uniref:Uncharacterized protein n=1 Tax=Rhizophora mucronata TaxID=61149 RepID=A0A2P2NL10_RHIMU